MKKWIALLVVVMTVFTLCGCTGNRLPEGMEAEYVEKHAKAVIALVNEKDYQTIWDEAGADFQAAVSAKELEEAVEGQIGDLGAFVEYSQQAIGGSHGKNGSGYGVAVITAKYENGKAVYTLSFDPEYKLAGFYVK